MDEICLLQKSKCLSCFDLHYKVESRRSGLDIKKDVKLNLKMYLSFQKFFRQYVLIVQ